MNMFDISSWDEVSIYNSLFLLIVHNTDMKMITYGFDNSTQHSGMAKKCQICSSSNFTVLNAHSYSKLVFISDYSIYCFCVSFNIFSRLRMHKFATILLSSISSFMILIWMCWNGKKWATPIHEFFFVLRFYKSEWNVVIVKFCTIHAITFTFKWQKNLLLSGKSCVTTW